ncbi:hypothetical protein GE09DRAFT_965429 [Coniochaeta sp. 2T2.1]|nr:hypothetical protein GE09DRAFT_965429 [Coniochaeta sp. 2T2.1]
MSKSVFKVTVLACLWSVLIGSNGGLASDKSSTYDYVIVGGGVSGLVVANRLTEGGKSTFANGPRATVPWWANGLDTSLLRAPTSAPVAGLHNKTFSVAVPAVVGGGSVVNGMAYARGSRSDYDAWEELGNAGWGWDGLLPYFKKSTTFDPPSREVVEEWNITWNPSVYGQGPLHVSTPDFQYPDQAFFWDALENAPIPKPGDPNQGSGPGAFWTPSTIDARDKTRATARKAYYDPVVQARPNLHLATGTTVTEILFDGLRAVGVKIVSSADKSTRQVFARKELILAAGAVQTPQLLQVSGIGPKSVLKSAGIKVKKDLPAVGANLQDHVLTFMLFNITNPSFPNPNTINTNATYNASVWEEYLTNKTGPIAAGSSDMTAFLSLPQISTDAVAIADEYAKQSVENYLPDAYRDKALLKGYKAQQTILAKRFKANDASVVGQPYPGGGGAPNPYLKPLSRGTINLNPTDPHGLPVVQYNTLQNPIDAKIILAIVRNARSFWKRPELAPLGPAELVPGPQFRSDEEILNALIDQGWLLPSLAHPSGTCAMAPEALGGCVGSDLRVYGVTGLSVVDASVMPLISGSPLQSTVYAVAEKAADIIKERG